MDHLSNQNCKFSVIEMQCLQLSFYGDNLCSVLLSKLQKCAYFVFCTFYGIVLFNFQLKALHAHYLHTFSIRIQRYFGFIAIRYSFASAYKIKKMEKFGEIHKQSPAKDKNSNHK